MTLTVRLSAHLKQQLDTYCKTRSITKTQVITELLSDHLSFASETGKSPYQLAREFGMIGSFASGKDATWRKIASSIWRKNCMQSVLVDAGPLIALADRSDKHHRRVAAYLRRFNGRLLTTWPVLAEVCHFLPERTQIGFLRWADADTGIPQATISAIENDRVNLGVERAKVLARARP